MQNQDFLKSLIKSGIQWAHMRSRRNPKMAPYIWGRKNNIDLFNVARTATQLAKAAEFLEAVAADGQVVLFLGTKKPAQEAILVAAKETGMPSVTHRWIGGTLSNWSQVKKSITKLLHFEDVLARAENFPNYTKKELNVLQKSLERLNKNVGGIRSMAWPVGALVVIDVMKEKSAVKEAAAMGVPVVALVDSNCDPSLINYVIPGNDDAPKAIQIILQTLSEAVIRGTAKAVEKAADRRAEDVTEELVGLKLLEQQSEEEAQKRRGSRGAPEAAGRGIGPKRDDSRRRPTSRPPMRPKK